jgi:hypothetical protein
MNDVVARKYQNLDPVRTARLQAAGFLTPPGAAPAPFGFGLLVQSTPAVGNDLHEHAEYLSLRMVALLRGREWHSKLNELLLSPLVIDPAIGAVEDYVRHGRKGRVDVGQNIPYASWMNASEAARRQLMIDNFRASFGKIHASHLQSADREAVLKALDHAANAR